MTVAVDRARGRAAHSDEIDHPFRSKPITRSDGNRSPVGASDAGPGIMSPGSLGSCRRSGLSHGLSLHVELERTRQRALTSRMLNAGRRGRLGALPDFQEEDDGLWALCETALFAVFQAPVGAVFASMGAVASTAPRGAPAVLLGPGRAGTQRHGGWCAPRAHRTRRDRPRARQTEAVRDVWPVICRRAAARDGSHESGFPVRVEGRRRLRIESPLRSSL